MKSFAKSVALITAFAVITRSLGFLFRIFLAWTLGPEMLGIYQIAMSFFTVFLTIIASGLPLAISKQVAADKKTPVASIALAGLLISLTVSCVMCGVVIVGRKFLGVLFTDSRCIYILIALLPAVIACSVYTVFRAVWWGQKKFFLLGITELFEQIVRIICFVIMLAFAFAFTDKAQIAGLSYTAACFISAIAVMVIYFKNNKLVHSREPYRPLIKSAAPITGVRILASIAMPVIAVIIPMRLMAAGWTNSQAISEYGIAVGMTLPLLTIPSTVISSLATVLVPELSAAVAAKHHTEVAKQITDTLKFTLFITFLMIPAFMSIGEGMGKFLFDNELAGTYLAQAAWIMVPMSLSQITNAILNSMGSEIRAMKHYALGSVFLFAAVWFLPKYFGVGALIIGLGLCMTIASALNLALIGKLSKADSKTGRLILSLTLISVPAFFAGRYTFGIFQHFQPLFISLGAAGGITVLVLLLFCRLFNIIDLDSLMFWKTKKKAV